MYFHFSGEEYEGEWKDGKVHGQGCRTFPSGAVYEGEWKDGKRHASPFLMEGGRIERKMERATTLSLMVVYVYEQAVEGDGSHSNNR